MLAAYPAGAYYRRHYDSYGGVDIPRRVTVLIYLGWSPRLGGALRAYLKSGATDIAPEPGRLVCFFSQEVEHEVLPTLRKRTCLIGWFHTPCEDA